MNITYCDRYVQIELFKGTRLLDKVLEYASKHFSKRYHLSSSLLILDDGERFKKDYLINWMYHATLQEDANAPESSKPSSKPDDREKPSRHSSKSIESIKQNKHALDSGMSAASVSSSASSVDSSATHADEDIETEPEPSELEKILERSHLPIRIKIANPNDVLKKVKIHIHISNLGQVILRLEENDRVARRYIHSLFGDKIVYEVDNEFCINSAGYSQSMWEGIISLIGSRIIHNVALEFEYEKPESSDSFLTREEYLLHKCYSELDVKVGDDMESVKKQYLKLAKIFHPDNAHGKDPHTVELYQDRFKRISDAYKTIKNSKMSHRTTA